MVPDPGEDALRPGLHRGATGIALRHPAPLPGPLQEKLRVRVARRDWAQVWADDPDVQLLPERDLDLAPDDSPLPGPRP
jgi:hypothetical protein